MVRGQHFETPEAALAFLNPQATNFEESLSRSQIVREHLLHPRHHHRELTSIASAADFETMSNLTLVYAGGGDGTVRRVIAASIGVVPDDFNETERRMSQHAEATQNVLLFAGKDGNACNFALSAHRRYATHPELLPYAQSIHVGHHRPIMREIIDADGNVVSNDIATSGLGFGNPAIAGEELQNAKPVLNELGPLARLVEEGKISLHALLRAETFSARLDFIRGELRRTLNIRNVSGLEFIGTDPYAKLVRTDVGVADTLWQPAVQQRYPGRVRDTLNFAETLARLPLGLHVLPTFDMEGMSMEIRLLSDEPVQFHEDGESRHNKTVLEPEQTMRLHLAQIAIPTLIIR